MDSLETISQRDNVCSILNILKTVLFIVVSVFVLYIPLGDPQVHCETLPTAQNRRVVLTFLCEAYSVAIKIGNHMIEVLKCIVCILLDLLYEAKLGFYALLEKIDHNDLCTSVCCNSNNNQREKAKEIRCPLCKCVRNRCKSNDDCR